MNTAIERPYRRKHPHALGLPRKIVDLEHRIQVEGEAANHYIQEFLAYLDQLGSPLDLEFPVPTREVDPLISDHLGQTPTGDYQVTLTTHKEPTRLLINIYSNPGTTAHRSVSLSLWPSNASSPNISWGPFDSGKAPMIVACARNLNLSRILLAATLGDIQGALQTAVDHVRTPQKPLSR